MAFVAAQLRPEWITDEGISGGALAVEEPAELIAPAPAETLPRLRASPGLELMLGRLGTVLEIDEAPLNNIVRAYGVPEERLDDISLIIAPASPALRYKNHVTAALEIDPTDGSVLPRYLYRQTVIVGLSEEDARRMDTLPVSMVAAASMHRAGEQAAMFYDLDRRRLPGFLAKLAVYGVRQGISRKRQVTASSLMGDLDGRTAASGSIRLKKMDTSHA